MKKGLRIIIWNNACCLSPHSDNVAGTHRVPSSLRHTGVPTTFEQANTRRRPPQGFVAQFIKSCASDLVGFFGIARTTGPA